MLLCEWKKDSNQLGISPEQEGSALGQLSANVEDGGRPCRSSFPIYEIQIEVLGVSTLCRLPVVFEAIARGSTSTVEV